MIARPQRGDANHVHVEAPHGPRAGSGEEEHRHVLPDTRRGQEEREPTETTLKARTALEKSSESGHGRRYW